MQESVIVGDKDVACAPLMGNEVFRPAEKFGHFGDECIALLGGHSGDVERHGIEVAHGLGEAQSLLAAYGMRRDHRRDERAAVMDDPIGAVGYGCGVPKRALL